jgi:uncharacterized membrane protein
MHLAHPLPWWLALLLAGAIAAAVIVEYRRPLSPLTRVQRGVLAGMRALLLAMLVLFLFRPIVLLPPQGLRDAIVPILIDASRSMRLNDAGNQTRLNRALAILKTELLPALGSQYRTEIFSVGDGLTPASPERIAADAPRTDLTGALTAVRERFRGQRVAGIVLVSDGGDTAAGGASAPGSSSGGGLPVYAIGVGSPDGPRDREIVGLVAGDPRLDQAKVDLHVTAVSTGFGRTAFPLRLLANGQVVETRRIVPTVDGSPIDEQFSVSPDPVNPTVYTAEVPGDASEPVVENNARSVLLSPPARKRRLLAIEGAPGFEHSFMTRTWALDSGLDVDSVTRKGKNGDGIDTFFVQAGAGRAAGLTTGFPTRKELLYGYDALIVANVEADFFTRAQLTMMADFVSERGGGLLVLGGRSFTQRGLSGTPLEDVLPVEVNDRRGGLVRTAFSPDQSAAPEYNRVNLTPEGETHPIMRLGATPAETRKQWAALPALASSAPLGGPRPGATVLAVTTAPGGGMHPVVAVQRYGQGRSMVFAGEAAWRWKMMVPSTDRSYEFFWRQAARWLSSASPEPVAVTVPDAPEPGDAISIDVDARDAAFAGVPDATVEASVSGPGGDAAPLKLRHADPASGRFTAAFRPERAGLYRIHADARRGSTPLGTAERWMFVGGSDREFADPKLNEGFLRRVARDSGGRYVRAGDAKEVANWLRTATPQDAAPERRDLWHEPWAYALVVGLLSAEWILRRRWGLR